MFQQPEDSESQSAFAGTAFAYKAQIFSRKNFNPHISENFAFLGIFDREIR